MQKLVSVKFTLSTKALERKLRAQQRAVKRAEEGALGEAATVLEADIKRRVYPAKRVSKQDAPAGRAVQLAGRSPVATRIERSKSTATVRVARHWTTARTPAVRATFARLGLADRLTRKGLYVTRDHEFVRFSSEPGLLKWAMRADKGQQYFRHVVRLTDPRAIGALQVKPGAAEAFPKASRIWATATRRALRT